MLENYFFISENIHEHWENLQSFTKTNKRVKRSSLNKRKINVDVYTETGLM